MNDQRTLDQVVVDALRFLARVLLPALEMPEAKRRLVVGSGNALPCGRAIFRDEDAVYADEGRYRDALERVTSIDGAVVISASGGKHAPGIVDDLKKRGLSPVLLTCNADSEAAKMLDCGHVIVTPSCSEPPTYNTSTYLGMILAKTRECPKRILAHVQDTVAQCIPSDLSRSGAFYLLLGSGFHVLRPMLVTKFDELFGPMLTGRCYTREQTMHAKTVVQSERELFVSFGCANHVFGQERCRLDIPLFEDAGDGAMMAVGYYVIGHIQRQNAPWFFESIDRYAAFQRKLFG